ncbi:MAG: dihydroorotase, multifunctional complex type [Deltaproteobacteria bacterium]|jgi:dihydroorotase|nr:dihydroorotase, multifunctional complex type [Deltaproteobacteria bacterium]
MLLIRGGRVIDPASRRDEEGHLVLSEGKVREFLAGEAPKNFPGRVIPAEGKWVVPGLIDMHVHLREPGYEWKEDIRSGTLAAAAGGFTTLACMGNTKPVNDHPEVTRFILDKARTEGAVNVFPVAAVTRGLEGKEMTDFTELSEAGAVAFSDDGKPVASALLMRRAMEYARPFGYLIMTHSEDPELAEGGAAHEGWTAQRLGLPGIPAAAEDIAIAREILLARQTGGRVHIQHISTRMGVDLLRMAKRAGLAVTGETAPQYFTLTDAALEGYDTNAKMNPPLRGEEDRMAILEGILDGTIDAVASDHAPHEDYVKRCEFVAAANGIIGLQTSLPLTLALLAGGKVSPSRAVDLLSAGPARLLSLKGKGTLAPGADADVTVVDPDAEWEFRKEDILSKSRNSPFIGWKLRGRAAVTICGGRIRHSCQSGIDTDG